MTLLPSLLRRHERHARLSASHRSLLVRLLLESGPESESAVRGMLAWAPNPQSREQVELALTGAVTIRWDWGVRCVILQARRGNVPEWLFEEEEEL